MSGLEMLLCPLGIAAMGGIAWVLTKLPGGAPSGSRGWPATRPACRWVPRRPQPIEDTGDAKGTVD
jgi:hypothetical protein